MTNLGHGASMRLYTSGRLADPARTDKLIVDLVLRSRPPSVVCRELSGLGLRPGAVHARILQLMDQAGGLDPTDRACFVLWGRARACEKSPTGWRLDARPVSLPTIIQTANHILGLLGLAAIPYPHTDGGK